MKILSISQVYYPDTASVAQHLSDLMEQLSASGHSVEVFTSNRDYENPQKKFKKTEVYKNVIIHRISSTGLGKKRRLFRIIDFLTFNISIFWKLMLIKPKEFDIIIGLTTPPLVSYLGIIFAKIKQSKFLYWTMDLQPELSIAAGYLKEGSFVSNFLQKRGDFIFKKSDKIIALDVYMQRHIENRLKSKQEKIDIIPVWPVMEEQYFGNRLDNPFRITNNFSDKIVIMYSGNHSVMHPLDTLLDAAKILQKDNRFLFVHIGGGVRLLDVKEFKRSNNLNNIIILPYQPRENIHLSLGSSDIQVVSLGSNCVGYTHPNKIYGAMFIGKPILYIGPAQSHITDILANCEGNIIVNHGDHLSLVNQLIQFASLSTDKRDFIGSTNKLFAENNFHPTKLKSRMITSIESIN